jgi:hypothetical protein
MRVQWANTPCFDYIELAKHEFKMLVFMREWKLRREQQSQHSIKCSYEIQECNSDQL